MTGTEERIKAHGGTVFRGEWVGLVCSVSVAGGGKERGV